MTSEESKAVTFVGILLALALVARAISKPKPIEIHAGAVDIGALQAASEAMQHQPNKARSKFKKRAAVTTETTPPPTPPHTWTVPAWKRGYSAPLLIEDQRGQKRNEKLELNHASVSEIEALPGVGPAMAKRIIARRDTIGRFEKLEDLDAVKGIGPSLLTKLKPLLVVR